MAWLRVEATALEDRALRRAGMHAKMAFVAALLLSKQRDWRLRCQRGFLPAAEFDGAEVARLWSAPDDAATVAAFDEGIVQLLREGLLMAADCRNADPADTSKGYWIARWAKYQKDGTAPLRSAKYRASKSSGGADLQDGDTVRHGQRRDAVMDAGDTAVTHHSVTAVSHGNETRRDDERSESSSSRVSSPLSGVPGGPEPAPARGSRAPAPAPPASPSGLNGSKRRHVAARLPAEALAAELERIDADATDARQPRAHGLLGLVRREDDWRDHAEVLLREPRTPAHVDPATVRLAKPRPPGPPLDLDARRRLLEEQLAKIDSGNPPS